MIPAWLDIGSLLVVIVGGCVAGWFHLRSVNAQIKAGRESTLKQVEENHVVHFNEAIEACRADFQHRLELFSTAFDAHRSDDLDFRQIIQLHVGELKASVARIEGRLNGHK